MFRGNEEVFAHSELQELNMEPNLCYKGSELN